MTQFRVILALNAIRHQSSLTLNKVFGSQVLNYGLHTNRKNDIHLSILPKYGLSFSNLQQTRNISVTSIMRNLEKTTPTTSTTTTTSDSQISNLKWDVADDLPISDTILTGPVIEFSDLNIIQEICYPYTFCVMHYLDLLLTQMPWWMAIVGTTITIRLCFLPLYIKQHKIGITSYNLMPQTQVIQSKMNDALASGETFQAAIERSKLTALEKQHGLTLWTKIGPSLVQAPMFICTFFLLRRYAEQPIADLVTGGDFWFTNLTIPDPYYILPTITGLSTLLLFELGAEGMMTPSNAMAPFLRAFMRIIPIAIVYVTSGFPTAVLLFWSTNNLITLLQSLVIKNKWVSQKLSIPVRLKHDISTLPLSNQTFGKQFKTATDTAKASNTTFDIRRLDDLAFRKAGVGPIPKTYKEPPIKVNKVD